MSRHRRRRGQLRQGRQPALASRIPVPSLTEKDLGDLEFALGLGVDFVALSFVRAASDVRELKEIIARAGSSAQVIAKIEKPEAVDALDEIARPRPTR